MSNLAYQQPQALDNLTYPAFAAHAAYRRAKRMRKILGLQRRYGACLLLLCLLGGCVALASPGTDLTALLVLFPLAIYLLTTRKAILYRPSPHALR